MKHAKNTMHKNVLNIETVDCKNYNYMGVDSTFILYRHIYIFFVNKLSLVIYSDLSIINVSCLIINNANRLGRRICGRRVPCERSGVAIAAAGGARGGARPAAVD